MAGTQLLVLQHKVQVISSQAFTYQFGSVTNDDVDAGRFKLTSAVDNMAKHGVACHGVQNLGQGRTHAGALTCGENNDIERHDWLPILGGQRLRPKSISRKKKKGSRGYPF